MADKTAFVISEGEDSFRRLRKEGYYYVDKTDFLVQFLSGGIDRGTLFTRPRRFGKTLTLTMLRDFLDITRNSRSIFEGLEVMNHPEIVRKYMNQFPVVFLTLKDVHGQTDDRTGAPCEPMGKLRLEISRVFNEADFLLDSPKLNRLDRKLFEELWMKKADKDTTIQGLSTLCHLLHKHFGVPAVVLIDEYDVPMNRANGMPFYRAVKDDIEILLSSVLKTNEDVAFCVMTGCLYTTKNSTYTGTNNMRPFTVLEERFGDAIGFTGEDVRQALRFFSIPDHFGIVEKWYDGYIFGTTEMYCPWDVLGYVKQQLMMPGSAPENYWAASSSNDLVHGFLNHLDPSAVSDLVRFLDRESLYKNVVENLPYETIYDKGENLWSSLVMTGYLTRAEPKKRTVSREGLMRLRIPNREIEGIFRSEIFSYFQKKVSDAHVSSLIQAFFDGDDQKVQQVLGEIILHDLSYLNEFEEYSYHLLLQGIFRGAQLETDSERQHGFGRSDLIVEDRARYRALVIEFKQAKDAGKTPAGIEAALEEGLLEALEQIKSRKYDADLKYKGIKTIFYYAISCSRLRCRVRLA